MDSRKSRTRSPNYPFIPLDRAIAKAELLWNKDGKVGAPRDVTLSHLGHNTESGAALRTISALKGFGLIRGEEGHIYLTNLAEKIILYRHDKRKQLEARREAVVRYPIYKILLERYGGRFPSKETLTAELIRKHNFNPKAVKGFLKSFFQTIKFAGLWKDEDVTDGDATVDEESGEIEEDYVEEQSVEEAGVTKKMTETKKAMTFLISENNWATITFSRWPVDSDDLEALKSYIDVSIGRLKKKEGGKSE